MYSKLSAISLLTLSTGADGAAGMFKEGKNNKGDSVLVSNVEKSNRKWVTFPEQKELHKARHLTGKETNAFETEARAALDAVFWKDHSGVLQLADDAELSLVKSWTGAGAVVTHQKFNQLKRGIRVHGGEFVATLGSHGGVLRVTGLPISASSSAADVSEMQDRKMSNVAVLAAVAKHADSSLGVTLHSEIILFDPVEIVWYNPLFAYGKEGVLSLAYYVHGYATESSKGQPFVFDSFVSALSGEVLDVVDRSKMAQASPFSYPIENARIKLYDATTGSRWGNFNLVFDTNDTPYTYPKNNDDVFNTVIDNTMYSKNLFYSLSNGAVESWKGDDTALLIAVNLTVENAFFDGRGIQFGEAFTTDDIVVHEWVHGYTDTLNGLVYRSEPGALNEALSDIFGEAIDILNGDTTDADAKRSVWPTQCHATLEDAWGQQAGSDTGSRWSLGENVTVGGNSFGDNSIRDMYAPECFWYPSSTKAPYYICLAEDYDGGGVHSNSAVPNRFFAVLVDGGEYEDPDGGENIEVSGIGFTKALNLMYRTMETLTSTSQFLDFSVAAAEICEDNIGATLYEPNLLDYTINDASETLTSDDCAQVEKALRGSGMDSDDVFCDNLECSSNSRCDWAECPSDGTVLAHEENFREFSRQGQFIQFNCAYEGTSVIARVFNQLDGLKISCIEFAYRSLGQEEVTLSLYVDSTGGAPDLESMTLLGNITVHSKNSDLFPQLQTLSFENPVPIHFPNNDATLVVTLSVSLTAGVILPGSQDNDAIKNTNKVTYLSGDCMVGGAFEAYDDSVWYVKLTGTSDGGSDDDGDDDVCFSGDSVVLMTDGSHKVIRDLRIGDKVFAAAEGGETVTADVVFLPHLLNTDSNTFVTIRTAAGQEVKMTPRHLLPAGVCDTGVELTLLEASKVVVGTCVNSVDGRQEVVSVSIMKGEGVYSFVTSHGDGHVFVDGVQASSFGIHHSAPNTFYTMHRASYALLQAVGISRELTHYFLTSKVVVGANRFVGDMAVTFGKLFKLV